MSSSFVFSPIGFMRTPFRDVANIPQGLGAEHSAKGFIELAPKFEEGLKDIEGFSHLFVIWVFHLVDSFELIVTPPSDIHPHGVFATRSPYRPNPIGLTVVILIGVNRNLLYVEGVDMVDGSPVLDIKPYLSGIPAEEVRRGWLAEAESR